MRAGFVSRHFKRHHLDDRVDVFKASMARRRANGETKVQITRNYCVSKQTFQWPKKKSADKQRTPLCDLQIHQVTAHFVCATKNKTKTKKRKNLTDMI